MPERFFTPEEIAETLRVKPYTVRQWLRSGRLRGILMGKRWRIRESALDEFIRAYEEETAAGGRGVNAPDAPTV